ncbi:RICIN domain-containing protein [Kitasatospora sp. NPDC002227]|uniref:RICIN domain-containing protein n=1 Tax=Kitasatospora sp. NPDC002227 TaxID=3154773 RepID=UPI0033237495
MRRSAAAVATAVLTATAAAGTLMLASPASADVPQGWAHIQNVGTGQYLDDYAHNTNQGAAVYTWQQTGQSNQWWWVANNPGYTVSFSSYETQQSGGLNAWWYRNLTRNSNNQGELGPQQVWVGGSGFSRGLPGEEKWWYAAGDAGTYIHSDAWNNDCLTAHPTGQVTVEGCRTGDHSQQWNIIYN